MVWVNMFPLVNAKIQILFDSDLTPNFGIFFDYVWLPFDDHFDYSDDYSKLLITLIILGLFVNPDYLPSLDS